MVSDVGASRYFISGGAGFIGSHFIERLLADGNTVTVYDNMVSGNPLWLKPHLNSTAFNFVEGDLLDSDRLKNALEGHDVVIHLGANTDIIKGNNDTRVDLENCTIATHNMLEAMRATGVSKILFASSATVYGDLTIYPTPESAGPLLPISLYGAGKLACEALISSYCHLFDMRAWIFRFGNVVGGRMNHGVIYDFIKKLEKNPNEIEILGDGKQQKNYFLVEDCVDGMLYAMRHANENPCELFNLGTETTITVKDIAHTVIKEMGLENTTLRYTGGQRGWPGDVPLVVFDVSRMKALGWETRESSEGAVRIAAGRLLLDGAVR